MKESEMKELDKLRNERRDLKYFLEGHGDLFVENSMRIFKRFERGRREIPIGNKEVTAAVFKVLEDRLTEINKTIEEI